MHERKVKRMTLHVQSNNECALEFYKKNGFTIKEHLLDYCTDLEPSDCYILDKEIELEDQAKEKKK